jgi:hypothetical protein
MAPRPTHKSVAEPNSFGRSLAPDHPAAGPIAGCRRRTWVSADRGNMDVSNRRGGCSPLARLLHNHHWIADLGLAIILYVACEMIYRDAYQLKPMIGVISLIFSMISTLGAIRLERFNRRIC